MAFLRYFIIALLISISSAHAEQSREYQVKAAFLFNFTKFVEWPEDKKHIRICTVGGNPFGDSLKILETAKAGEREVQVITLTEGDGSKHQCNIMFINNHDGQNLKNMLTEFTAARILTVGDSKGFAEKGGMIEFATYEGKIKLVINKTAINAAGLKIDPSLLEIAWRVVE